MALRIQFTSKGRIVNRTRFAFGMLLLLMGCASNSGVAPMGPDTYMVTRQAATGFSGDAGRCSCRSKASIYFWELPKGGSAI